MNAYAQSRYNICVPLRNGRQLVYNGLSGATAVWDRSETEAFEHVGATGSCAPGPVFKALLRGGFIVRAENNELEILRREYEAHRYDPKVLVLTIAPTLACNFGCDYCFQGCHKPTAMMSESVQDAVIAFVQRAAPRINRLSISWYGGEPLLGLGIIEGLAGRLIAIAEQRGLRYDSMIVTNGYRLTAEVAGRLHRQRVSTAQVTLDGDTEWHDQRRTLLGGQPTFDRITRNLRDVVASVPLRISLRVNIDERNAASVRPLLERLAKMGFGRRGNFGVYFAPVEAITEKCHDVTDVCLSKSVYAALEAELVRYAFDLGLTSLPYPPRFRGVCGAMRPKGFVVAPNGDLHKCWDTISMPEQRVGTVFDVDALRTDPRLLSWMRWTPFDSESCRNCRLLPSCAGACAHKFVNPEQTRGEGATLPCPSWKFNINERLVLTAERRGAISSDDYEMDEIRTDPNRLCVTAAGAM